MEMFEITTGPVLSCIPHMYKAVVPTAAVPGTFPLNPAPARHGHRHSPDAGQDSAANRSQTRFGKFVPITVP